MQPEEEEKFVTPYALCQALRLMRVQSETLCASLDRVDQLDGDVRPYELCQELRRARTQTELFCVALERLASEVARAQGAHCTQPDPVLLEPAEVAQRRLDTEAALSEFVASLLHKTGLELTGSEIFVAARATLGLAHLGRSQVDRTLAELLQRGALCCETRARTKYYTLPL